jgi:hypothetical protein
MIASTSLPPKPHQRDRLLALLEIRSPSWVPLVEILGLKIAQYSSHLYELRRLGYWIESKQEEVRSCFRLVPPPDGTSFFGDLAPKGRYP